MVIKEQSARSAAKRGLRRPTKPSGLKGYSERFALWRLGLAHRPEPLDQPASKQSHRRIRQIIGVEL